MNSNGFFGIGQNQSPWVGNKSSTGSTFGVSNNAWGTEVGIGAMGIGGALSFAGGLQQFQQIGSQRGQVMNKFGSLEKQYELLTDQSDSQLGNAQASANIKNLQATQQALSDYNKTLLQSAGSGQSLASLGSALSKSFTDANNQQWLNDVELSMNKANILFSKAQGSLSIANQAEESYQNVLQINQQASNSLLSTFASGFGTVAGIGLMLL